MVGWLELDLYMNGKDGWQEDALFVCQRIMDEGNSKE